MIEKTVHQWLGRANDSKETAALVVQFTQFPDALLEGLNTAGERIQAMKHHVANRLEGVQEQLKALGGALEVHGTGGAIIRASPDTLRTLVSEDGLLAKAQDLKVRPNVEMPGLGTG